jgi:F-box domain
MSAHFNPAAPRAVAHAAGSATPTTPLHLARPLPRNWSPRRSQSSQDLALPARPATFETTADDELRRRASTSDLVSLAEPQTGFSALPAEAVIHIFDHLSLRDQMQLAQVSRDLRQKSQEPLKNELAAKQKIDALMDDMAMNFGANTLPNPGLVDIQGPVNSLVDVPMVSQYLIEALANSRAADIDISKLTQVPAQSIAHEEKRAEMVLLFCGAVANAIRESMHLESVKADMCDVVFLSSGDLIKRKREEHAAGIATSATKYMFGGNLAQQAGFRPKLLSVDVGNPKQAGFLMDYIVLSDLKYCSGIKQLHLRLQDAFALNHSITNHGRDMGQIVRSTQEFGLSVDAIKSISSDRYKQYYGQAAVLQSSGLHASLQKLTPEQDLVETDFQSSFSRQLQRHGVFTSSLENTTRVTVLPPQDPSTPFTPDDLFVSADLFLKVPQLKTLVTLPVYSSDAAEHQATVQHVLELAQAHPHLSLIQMGDAHYKRSEARPEVAFDKV